MFRVQVSVGIREQKSPAADGGRALVIYLLARLSMR